MYERGWAAIPAYCAAKCAADDYLLAESRATTKARWEDICLRPGTLTDAPGTGKVDLGQARLGGGVSREDVAAVAVELLERGVGGRRGVWLDLVSGGEDLVEAVQRCIQDAVTVSE